MLDWLKRKPAIEHSNPKIRLEALEALDENEQARFIDLARSDHDPDVRLAACRRISELASLHEFIEDATLGEFCAEAIAASADKSDPLSTHPRVVHKRLAQSPSAAAALSTAKLLDQPALVAEAILQTAAPELRHDVVALLDSEELLTSFEKASRNKDKTVNRLVRDRFERIKDLRTSYTDAILSAKNVITRAESLHPPTQHYVERRDAVEAEWQACLNELRGLVGQLGCFLHVDGEISSLESLFPARIEVDENESDAIPAASALLIRLHQSDGSLEELEEIEDEWAKLVTEDAPPDLLARNFYEDLAQLRATAERLDRKSKVQKRVDELAKEISPIQPGDNPEKWSTAWRTYRAAKRRIRDIENFTRQAEYSEFADEEDWEETFSKATRRLEDLRSDVEQLANRTTSKIERNLESLDELITNGDVQLAFSKLRNTQRLILCVPERRRAEWQAKLKPVSARVNELKDWQSFAESPKRDSLCEAVEELVQSPETAQVQSERLKSLRQEWNKLGRPVTRRELELTDRFNDAAEKAFEICRAAYREMQALRTANYRARRNLCDQLSDYVEKYDWENPDWRSVTNTLRRAREEWQQLTPVDQRRGRSVSARYHALTKDIQKRITEYRSSNAKEKRELIAQLAAAIDDDTVANTELTDLVKSLQAQWKNIGPAQRKVDTKLWTQFREKCDFVFEMRNEQRNERRKSIDKNIERAAQLVDELADSIESDDDQEQVVDAGMIRRCQSEVEALDLPRRIADQMSRRIQEMFDKLSQSEQRRLQRVAANSLAKLIELETQRAQFECERSDIPDEWFEAVGDDRSWFDSRRPTTGANASDLRGVVIRLEILGDITSPPEDQTERMMIQAARLETRFRSSSRVPEESVEDLIHYWCGSAYGDQPLRERFVAAAKAALNR